MTLEDKVKFRRVVNSISIIVLFRGRLSRRANESLSVSIAATEHAK